MRVLIDKEPNRLGKRYYSVRDCCRPMGELTNYLNLIDMEKDSRHFVLKVPRQFSGSIGIMFISSVKFEWKHIGTTKDKQPAHVKFCPYCGAEITFELVDDRIYTK